MAVYFAQVGDYIKIGHSRDPFHRVSTITRTGIRPDDVPHAAKADLIGWIPGDTWRETEIHGRFTSSRVKGEWFRLDVETVRDLIWDDPRGVDMTRMSAFAVLMCDRNPNLTRDEVQAAGIPLIAVPEVEALRSMSARFSQLSGGAA